MSAAQSAVVVRVVDGDGICVRPIGSGTLAAGEVHEISLIGANAPAVTRCWAPEATALAVERIGAALAWERSHPSTTPRN